MVGKRALKVYRTAIGFYDAFVAAPSQKAALAAWGSDKNLFTSGFAEVVTDPELIREPLAQPGVVVRRPRGTAAEHIAALPKTASPKARKTPSKADTFKQKPAKRGARPNRSALAKAEAVLEKEKRAFADKLAALDAEIARMRQERGRLLEERDNRLDRLEARREAQEAAYRDALDKWRG